MKTIPLDLTDCQYLSEIHQRIQVAFDFSEGYGKNWDAFWDLLWSECDADKVIVRGENTLPGDFAVSLRKLHDILERNIIFRKENGLNPFSYEIADEMPRIYCPLAMKKRLLSADRRRFFAALFRRGWSGEGATAVYRVRFC